MAPARLERWVANFEARHGRTALEPFEHGLAGTAEDGSWFRAVLPFSATWSPGDRSALPAEVVDAAAPPGDWGLLLVRKGGFAVARLAEDRVVARKTGRRHVQGRTKAGGQSQQRFARRRDGQARVAYAAAAEHASSLFRGPRDPGVPGHPDRPVRPPASGHALPVVVGGDRDAVRQVLADPRLVGLESVGRWLAVPDPRAAVLDQALLDAKAFDVEVHNA